MRSGTTIAENSNTFSVTGLILSSVSQFISYTTASSNSKGKIRPEA